MKKPQTLYHKTWWWTALALLGTYLGAVPPHCRGEDPPAKDSPGLGKKAEHPLPKYFDQLDLTDQQKEKVIAMMDECAEKVAHHQNEVRKLRGKLYVTSLIMAHAHAIKKLRAQRQAAVEKILDDDQRAKLKELRARDEGGN
jgi:Spy/CpxP family protein refolding chaperone